MTDDGQGDWRHWASSTLAKDVPPAYPGGPSHKAGALVLLSTLTTEPDGRLIGFPMPSPTALALSLAISAAKEGNEIRSELTTVQVVSPDGWTRQVPPSEASKLYDYFERCMMTMTFSFNALEIFCNQTIADEIKGTYARTTHRGVVDMTPDKVQRELSTEEKLTAVLPTILGTANPKDDALVWRDFLRLKRARDATIHMKASDAYIRGGKVDERTLFHEFFAMKSLVSFPIFAVGMIRFFRPNLKERRWLREAIEMLGLA